VREMTMAFIQLIEYTTSRIDEANRLFDQWLAETQGKRTTQRIVLTSDRDRPNTYIEIVEFPSYEEAMRNSELPETQAISAQLVSLCEAEPIFRNLDVVRDERL
jgi:quinol monooxygenase YgiN